LLYRVDNRIHTYSTKNCPFWTLAEVLANYTKKSNVSGRVGEDKLALGRDIDIAVIRNDRTIEWVARKPWYSERDFTQHSK
jgi:hypothetical protein